MIRLAAVCVILTQVFLQFTNADIYFHNPRGSNNRLNGAKVNRQNAKRLFDSQNNAKGGYNAGENSEKQTTDWYNMKYFMSGPNAKTILSIEWTNQHGCGDGDLNCDIVLQYMCQPSNISDETRRMRNGAKEKAKLGFSTKRPMFISTWNRTRVQKRRRDDNNPEAGLHEQWEWYDKCFFRYRNHGLFTAGNLKRRATRARFTRQNRNGARYGYECPEDRAYYPYWHPTDWKDIAVLTNIQKCSYYKKESFNNASKAECVQLHRHNKPWDAQTNPWRHRSTYNTQALCEEKGGNWILFHSHLETIDRSQDECTTGPNGERLIWAIPYRTEDIAIMPGDIESWKRCFVALDPPDCLSAPHSRSNHLGNGIGAVPLTYDWAIPHFPSGQEQTCVLRIRYNISTNDYDPKNTFSDKNGANSPIENNPTVQLGANGNTVPLKLAINTAQFGRTFQDRSHIFKIVPRKEHFQDKTIYNLNVRGKRGNIVQAYPAVEYDFVPKRLSINSDDLVCIQWTGSNSNPKNYAGQGRKQTDRHNMVSMSSPDLSYPTNTSMFENAQLVHALDERFQNIAPGEDLAVAMATSGHYTSVGEVPASFENAVEGCNAEQASELDCYNPSFPCILLKFNKGTYYYMCTRNNNFTNRNQKGRLIVN